MSENVITTKAIIADKESDISYYILGNKTHELIEMRKWGEPLVVNAVTTRSQNKIQIRNRNSN